MISIKLADLKHALAGLGKVVSTSAKLECLRCVRVDAAPNRTTFSATDLDITVQVTIPEARSEKVTSFLLPLARLQSVARRLPNRASIYLEEGKISCDLGSGRVTEDVESPVLDEFPEEAVFHVRPVPLPESFSHRFTEAMACSSTDQTRLVLNGALLDVSSTTGAGHYLVATDGKHLFSANSFTLPISHSVIVPSHKIFSWRGLTGGWALAGQPYRDSLRIRFVVGNWTITSKVIDGNYPNWRQVVPDTRKQQTIVSMPVEHDFSKIVNGLPGGELKDKPVDLVIEDGTVGVRDTIGGTKILLAGSRAKGPNITIRLNREYLGKAFDFGLTRIGLFDRISPLHFSHEGRQMVIMPLRVPSATTERSVAEKPKNQTAPSGPQPERKPMPNNTVHTTKNNRSVEPEQPTNQPALEAAIDKIDAFKGTVRETLTGLNDLSALLRQALRDQKADKKEVNNVRQTLRSLQSVKI